MPQVYGEDQSAAIAGIEAHADLLHPERLPGEIKAWFGADRDQRLMPVFEASHGICMESGQTRFWGINLGRPYKDCAGPLWFCGTYDAARWVGDTLSVGDLKTGWAQAHGSLPATADSGQLRGLACLVIKARQAQTLAPGDAPPPVEELPSRLPRIRLAYFTTANQVGIETLDAEIEGDDLRAWWKNLVKGVRATAKARPIIRRNSYCGTCNAFEACPAQGDAIRRLLNHPGGPIPKERLVEAYYLVKEAKRALEQLEHALPLAVARHGEKVKLGNRTLGLVRGSVVRINAEGVLNSGILGDQGAACLSPLSMSQESIRRGLGISDAKPVIDQLIEAGLAERINSRAHLRLVDGKRKDEDEEES